MPGCFETLLLKNLTALFCNTVVFATSIYAGIEDNFSFLTFQNYLHLSFLIYLLLMLKNVVLYLSRLCLFLHVSMLELVHIAIKTLFHLLQSVSNSSR